MRVAAGVLVLALVAAGCARRSVWEVPRVPSDRALTAALAPSGGDDDEVLWDAVTAVVPDIKAPSTLRPCCAFGARLQLKVGPVPIPGYTIDNVVGPDDIGPHVYDGGGLVNELTAYDTATKERNGLVYTCRGGFIDTAHVRDYADLTVFLTFALYRILETGGTVELSEEGGRRTVGLRPIPAETIERQGRLQLSIALAQWLAFDASIWHEIATWYGWAKVPVFSERPSAFSPEDLYSNLLGVRIAGAILVTRGAETDRLYNQTMKLWLDRAFEVLGAAPGWVGDAAADSVDGLWWDSKKRLPDAWLLRRRSFDLGPRLTPWRVPASRASGLLRDGIKRYCPSRDTPLVLVRRTGRKGLTFRDVSILEVAPEPDLAAKLPPPFTGATRVTSADFPAIVRAIRQQNASEFGAGTDVPDDQADAAR
jgi:hypothetical protein